MSYVYAGYAVIIGLLGAYAVALVVRRRRLDAAVAALVGPRESGSEGRQRVRTEGPPA